MQFVFVSLAPKYLNSATSSNSWLAVFLLCLCLALCLRYTIVYLFSACTSILISISVTGRIRKPSFFIMCTFWPKKWPSACRSVTKLLVSFHFCLSWFDVTLVLAVAYSGVKAKSSGDKAHPCFRPLWKTVCVREMLACPGCTTCCVQTLVKWPE